MPLTKYFDSSLCHITHIGLRRKVGDRGFSGESAITYPPTSPVKREPMRPGSQHRQRLNSPSAMRVLSVMSRHS